MIINPYAFGTGTPFLNTLAVQPNAVLSLRKMVATATTSIRVRRSSDSSELDIGFSGTSLDTSALAAFVGGNSAFVTKVYDQTGNGFDAVQATAANQPRIVNAGVLDPAITFDGTSDSLKITALTQGAAQVGIYGKYGIPTTMNVAIIAEQSPNYNNVSQAFVLYRDSLFQPLSMSMRNSTGASDFRLQGFNASSGSGPTFIKQVTTLYDRSITGSGEELAWQDGVPLTPSNPASGGQVEQTGVFSAYDIYIGARGGTSLFGNLQLDTMAFYNADTASIRTSIEAVVA